MRRATANLPGTGRVGHPSPVRNESRTMTNEPCNADRSERPEQERLTRLSEARAQMAAALELLDDHSRSAAAATLDLAIHHLDGEMAS